MSGTTIEVYEHKKYRHILFLFAEVFYGGLFFNGIKEEKVGTFHWHYSCCLVSLWYFTINSIPNSLVTIMYSVLNKRLLSFCCLKYLFRKPKHLSIMLRPSLWLVSFWWDESDAKRRRVCLLPIQKVSNLASRKVGEQIKPHKSNTPEPHGLNTPCNIIFSVHLFGPFSNKRLFL